MKLIFSMVTLLSISLSVKADPLPPASTLWSNILNIHIQRGRTYTLYNPHRVLRPYKGNLLRVVMPDYCRPTTVNQMVVWGVTLNGQRVQLLTQLRNTEVNFGTASWIFTVNGNSPATIHEIGLDVVSARGCTLAFEQANEFPFPPPQPVPPQPTPQPVPPLAGCEENYACPMHIDSTRYCEAISFVGAPSFTENSNGTDNSCTITRRLKKQLCTQGLSPLNYNIICH